MFFTVRLSSKHMVVAAYTDMVKDHLLKPGRKIGGIWRVNNIEN